jgi:hypothetical protein
LVIQTYFFTSFTYKYKNIALYYLKLLLFANDLYSPTNRWRGYVLILFRSDTVEIHEQISGRECGVDQYGKPRKCIRLLSIVDGDLKPPSSGES